MVARHLLVVRLAVRKAVESVVVAGVQADLARRTLEARLVEHLADRREALGRIHALVAHATLLGSRTKLGRRSG